MIDDYQLLEFTVSWWSGFVSYEEEEGRAYSQHVFERIDKHHFVDFLRDALAEFGEQNASR